MNLPTDHDLCFAPATEQRALLATRQISARELLEAYLARIEQVNPAVNAIVTIDPVGARAQADASDAARTRADAMGPLAGLVVAHKDLVNTGGMRSTQGSPIYRDFIPT